MKLLLLFFFIEAQASSLIIGSKSLFVAFYQELYRDLIDLLWS